MIWSGEDLEIEIREGTSDWNTVQACIGEDEYGLRDVDMDGKLVFDVGSHIGSIGIWCAKRGATVVCVEPVPPNADLIWANAKSNGVSDFVTVLRAVAGKHGTEQPIRWGFTHDENARHHAFIGNIGIVEPVEPFESEIVPAYSLSDMISIYGAPDIIKIDCEGGEWAWFEEPELRHVPLIVGEWHPTDGHVRGDMYFRLKDSHHVGFTGPEAGPGGFRAELR